MPKYSFKTIEQMLLKCAIEGGDPELFFHLRGAGYMIIAYADRCSFQRCSDELGANASGERYFSTLRELYTAPQIDGRSLEDFGARRMIFTALISSRETPRFVRRR